MVTCPSQAEMARPMPGPAGTMTHRVHRAQAPRGMWPWRGSESARAGYCWWGRRQERTADRALNRETRQVTEGGSGDETKGHGQANEQNGMFTQSGILPSLKEEGNSDTCHNVT